MKLFEKAKEEDSLGIGETNISDSGSDENEAREIDKIDGAIDIISHRNKTSVGSSIQMKFTAAINSRLSNYRISATPGLKRSKLY